MLTSPGYLSRFILLLLLLSFNGACSTTPAPASPPPPGPSRVLGWFSKWKDKLTPAPAPLACPLSAMALDWRLLHTASFAMRKCSLLHRRCAALEDADTGCCTRTNILAILVQRVQGVR